MCGGPLLAGPWGIATSAPCAQRTRAHSATGAGHTSATVRTCSRTDRRPPHTPTLASRSSFCCFRDASSAWSSWTADSSSLLRPCTRQPRCMSAHTHTARPWCRHKLPQRNPSHMPDQGMLYYVKPTQPCSPDTPYTQSTPNPVQASQGAPCTAGLQAVHRSSAVLQHIPGSFFITHLQGFQLRPRRVQATRDGRLRTGACCLLRRHRGCRGCSLRFLGHSICCFSLTQSQQHQQYNIGSSSTIDNEAPAPAVQCQQHQRQQQ